MSTVFLWIGKNEKFSEQYARAVESRTDYMSEEILEIADDGTNDYRTYEKDGKTVSAVDHDHIQRSRLRVDTRKWLMAKMAPKKYGDFQRTEVTGKDGAPLNQNISDEQLESKLVDLLRKAGAIPAPDGEGSAQADA